MDMRSNMAVVIDTGSGVDDRVSPYDSVSLNDGSSHDL
jgi:hypothetical protein